MGNRSRRELEGQAILREMLAHPPKPKPHPPCKLCGEPAVIGAHEWRDVHYFCETHRAEAYRAFGLQE